MIRIDAIRELRRDLHMRPFEADRRVYLIFRANLLGEDAADALLKDLEEPPPYAVIVLVADDIGPIPETLRSRCQLVPFSRLSERAIRERVDVRAPELSDAERAAVARVAAGRIDRMERLLDPKSVQRRTLLIEQARAVYRDPAFDAEPGRRGAPPARARPVDRGARPGRGPHRRHGDDGARRRAAGEACRARRLAREELLAQIEELGAWYRDLVAVAVGADAAAIHLDLLPQLREDATRERIVGAERAAEHVRDTWRILEEFNLAPQLALEALFIKVAGRAAPSEGGGGAVAKLGPQHVST